MYQLFINISELIIMYQLYTLVYSLQDLIKYKNTNIFIEPSILCEIVCENC
jgi:hypothetical protein